MLDIHWAMKGKHLLRAIQLRLGFESLKMSNFRKRVSGNESLGVRDPKAKKCLAVSKAGETCALCIENPNTTKERREGRSPGKGPHRLVQN